ncbi:MAG TPA: hypothetical protein VJ719_01555, partial [Chthoniobacterales bacterium]|nr:hypothetical protein [Chthoniobacterales bacterium]
MTVASMADDRTAMRSDAEMTQGSSGNSPEVIFVTSFLPFPVDHGGAMAREGFIRALSACASVNVLVLTSIQYDDAVIAAADAHYTQFCRSFRCHRFPDLSPDRALLAKTWDYLRGYPRNGFWSEEAAAILEHRILSSRCQVVWCDSVFNAKYLAQAKRLNCRTVLTNHNVESDLVGAPASATGVARFKSWLNRLDLRRLERLGARLADVVTAITGEDLKYYRRLKDDRHALLLGYSYPVDPTISDSNGQEPGMICFVGSMNWPPNVRAARYLVHEIMPLVWKSEPGAKCYIIGK